jgi:hypothetical protein
MATSEEIAPAVVVTREVASQAPVVVAATAKLEAAVLVVDVLSPVRRSHLYPCLGHKILA